MSNWWVVNKDTGAMIDSGDDAFKAAMVAIGADQKWLEVPEGVAIGNAKVQGTGDSMVLVDGSADKAGPKWDALKAERYRLLEASRWIIDRHTEQVAAGISTSLTAEQYAAWLAYRQDLRDIVEDTTDPDAPSWPSEPA